MQCVHLMEETMQEHPKLDDRAMRNVVASYVRDGCSQKDAVREAQKWRERMTQSAEMIRQGKVRS